jgi:putative ABC transport system ATP-binding protein
MYVLSDVTKTYRKGHRTVTALDNLDLTIAEGEWLAIQGRTGSGKTTLLQLLGALDHPSGGVIDFDGRDLARLPEVDLAEVRADSIGFVFQTFNLIPTLSAVENVEAALIPQRLLATQRRERASNALASVGLAERANHLPSEMSGGQQQRVGIARALVKEPKVLLADEPTGNLDIDTRDEIMSLLETLWADRGLTLVVVTHDTSIARRAERVATMRDGHLSIGSENTTKDADDD